MRTRPVRWVLGIALVLAAVLLSVGTVAAQTFKVLHTFTFGPDGGEPHGGLAMDAAGNLYGTTLWGGDHGIGVVFQLSPNPDGTWTHTVLHSFAGGIDGAEPVAEPVIDAAGNVYGMAQYGGLHGQGLLFQLSPSPGGWTYRVLHQFEGGQDGGNPTGLIMTPAGRMYGVTAQGPRAVCTSTWCGTVFELVPGPAGAWTYKVIHNFRGDRPLKGMGPITSLSLDGFGILTGTTYFGGAHDEGVVFTLWKKPGGKWVETVLHHFTGGSDGGNPMGQLVVGANGRIFGTSSLHGSGTLGNVYSLHPFSGARELHSFTGGSESCIPWSAVRFDSAGNLYGTASGENHDPGTVFKLTPAGAGTWTFDVVHPFTCGSDGCVPLGPVIVDEATGKLYGTANYGGPYNGGVVFEITP